MESLATPWSIGFFGSSIFGVFTGISCSIWCFHWDLLQYLVFSPGSPAVFGLFTRTPGTFSVLTGFPAMFHATGYPLDPQC